MPFVQLTTQSIIDICNRALAEINKAVGQRSKMRSRRENFEALRSRAAAILVESGPTTLVGMSPEDLTLIAPYL